VRIVTAVAAHLHLVTDDEAVLLERRARARARFMYRYDAGEGRRTMVGALDRLALTFSGGRLDGAMFPWEALCDDDLAEEVWRATADQYASATAQRDASALRMILEACWKEGLLTFDQYQRATSFRSERTRWTPPPGRTLTDQEVSALIAYDPPRAPTSLCLRDRALVYLFASTGARRTEMSHVSVANIDLIQHELRLEVTKSGVPRDAWLHPAAVSGLHQWFDVRGDATGPALLALSRTGRPLPGRPLSPHQMWKVLRQRSIDCGIGPVTPHDMRRFVVTRLLEGGHDLLLVSRLVGHSDPATTKLYDRRPAEACRAAVATLPLPLLA
jgi:integrase